MLYANFLKTNQALHVITSRKDSDIMIEDAANFRVKYLRNLINMSPCRAYWKALLEMNNENPNNLDKFNI
jgi:hypothetical protein